MSVPVAYGIDFGTSNSAISAYLSDGEVEVIDTDPSTAGMLPSLLYLHRDGNQLAGTNAAEAFLTSGTDKTRCRGCALVDWFGGEALSDCRQVRDGGFCMDARLISQIKSSLSDTHLEGTHSWGRDFDMSALVVIVLGHLKRAADRHYSVDVRRVAIGHPVRFAGAEGPQFKEAQALACSRLKEAAHEAGFDEVALVPESQAAIALEGVTDGYVMCTDFGGGTFDCSVVDVLGINLTILALDGVAVGGEDFDSLIFDAFICPAIGLDREFVLGNGQTRQLPARLRSRLRSLSGLRMLLADPETVGMLSGFGGLGGDVTLDTVGELLFGGQALPFYRAIEKAKIDLSLHNQASVDFRRPWIDLHETITRDQFEQLLTRSMQRVRDCMLDACASARIDAEDVTFVTKTGGSSQIPAFAALLRTVFPHANLIECDPFTAVVKGLAEFAGGEWGNA